MGSEEDSENVLLRVNQIVREALECATFTQTKNEDFSQTLLHDGKVSLFYTN